MQRNEDIFKLLQLADNRKFNSDFVGAIEARQSLEAIYAANLANDIKRIHNLQSLANLAVQTRNLSEAEQWARKALSLCTNLSTELRATANMLLSMVLAEAGKFAKAVPHAEQAIALFASNHGPESDFVKFRRADLNRMRDHRPGPYVDP